MMNPYVMRRYVAFILMAFIPAICFYVGIVFYGMGMGIGLLFLGILVGLIMANLIIRNPFTMMLEGKGILVINMDSTGILQPFIVGLENPYLKGFFKGKRVKDVFDREAVQQLANPKKAKNKAKIIDGKLTFELTEDEYHSARFGLSHYPVLIYNSNMQSFITKDFLSHKETDTFANHGILYLNRNMEELTSAIRDFGRHIVDNLKPKEGFLANKWVWIIVFVLAIGAFLFLFGPPILEQLGVLGSTATQSFSSAGGNPITPQ